MSWMDSWSRPSKSQATPVPYYMLPGGENTPYCHSCGRVIGQRKANAAATAKSEARYCSSRCRSHKPGGKLDREIEGAFVAFLDGQADVGAVGGEHRKPSRSAAAAVAARQGGKGGKKMKGDQRILVPCSAVEDLVFGKKDDGSADGGTSTRSGTPEPETEHDEHPTEGAPVHAQQQLSSLQQDDDLAPEEVAEGMVLADGTYIDGDVLARMSVRSGTRIRPPQHVSEVNGSVGGEKGRAERIEENEEMLEKRRLGQRRAKEKEMVKCAARRGVVFGFSTAAGPGEKKEGSARRMCEAVMNGKVVEPSFAKGDWQIRWRE